ncbi:hypothetical protein Tco_1351463 [Tanacetum coccineum]
MSKKKAPTKAERSKGIELLFEAASLEEAQLKKDIKRSKQETNIHQAGGSSKGADSKIKVDSSESESESWGDSDDDDDDQQSDDERTESDDDKSVNLNKTDDEEEYEFIHTPDDYVLTDDENVDDEEFKRINEEMYNDVNVELKDSEREGKEKDDEEMTDASHVETKHENVNQEVAGDTEIISMMDVKFQHEDPSIQTSPLLIVPVTTLRNIDHTSAIRAAVKYEVPTIVKEYIGTSLDDALHKALQRYTAELVKEHYVPADVTNVLQQQQKPQKSVVDIRKIKMEQARKQQEPKYTIISFDVDALREFDQKQTLFETMTKTKLFKRNSKHKALYHALMESILEDEDAIDKGPPAEPDQGLKKKKTCKETKPSKKAKSAGTSKGGSTSRKYTTSLTKTKAAKYDLPGIKDMVPNLWSPIKVAFDKHALLVTNVKLNIWYGYGHLEEIENRLFNLKGEDIVHLATALCMFTRHILIQKRVEYLQLGVESNQKKLNISKPRTHEEDLSRRAPYTTLSYPQGVIYEDRLNRNRLMHSDELYKFSDGTLQSVRDTLHHMATNLRIGYNKAMPKRIWSQLDKTRSHVMVKEIDHQLRERRLMRSLEKFIGGRHYREDLRLLQQTI